MNITDLSCNSPESAEAVRAYLVQQIVEARMSGESVDISARVEGSTLRITYRDVPHRREWETQLMGFRDGYEEAKL